MAAVDERQSPMSNLGTVHVRSIAMKSDKGSSRDHADVPLIEKMCPGWESNPHLYGF